MKQNNKKQFCSSKRKIIIIIMGLILGFLSFFAIKAYAVNFELDQILGAVQGVSGNQIQNYHEETLVRMATSLSKGEDINNTVNKDSLTNFFNKYIGIGQVAIQETANNLLNIQFNNTGNLYQINILSGFLEWIQNLTYKITYDANGGIMLPYVQFGKPAQQITLTNFKPTRSGYIFLGWSTSQNATTAEYNSEDTFIGVNDAVLYAVWEEKIILETYTIIYNANGGSGEPETQRITQGESLTIPNVEPTRPGCTFLGWSTNSNATSATYEKGQTYQIDSSMALYAVWQVNGYTVTYHTNGGSGVPAQETVDYGGSVVVSSIEPTKTGYVFLGWDTSSTATTVIYRVNDMILNIRNNINLYAVWEEDIPDAPEIPTYTITFNANGGSGGPSSVNTNPDGTATIPTTQPTRSYMMFMQYTFLGWSKEQNATTATYAAGATIPASDITGDMTLYAVWQSSF